MLSKGRRLAVLERGGWRCFYCGNELDAALWKYRHAADINNLPEMTPDFMQHAATVDHQTPVNRGGSDRDENVVAACLSCNSKKRQLTVEEFRFYLSRQVLGRGAAADLLREAMLTTSTPFDREIALAVEWLEEQFPAIIFFGENSNVQG